ncbi:MAG: histidine phosphatase family protein [Anaerolineales bacterium]|nr:histidine phosphatase family protein [Anaerolineales bacterium]
MKTLLILRHAKSSWKDDSLPDHDRPLNKRGKQDAPRMGTLLRREELLPDLILCSTARRARATADLVIDASGYEGELHLSLELYSFDAEPYLEALAELDDEYRCVMLVGHNPAMEELVEALVGHFERMPTAALAQIELPINSWSELDTEVGGALVNLWNPKQL